MITIGSQAKPRKRQHKTPCHDCPWRRNSLAGWLGTPTADEWIQSVQGESRIECHTISNQQCAGAAIFRANICKRPRNPDLLVLPPDKVRVFSWPNEFKEYHK